MNFTSPIAIVFLAHFNVDKLGEKKGSVFVGYGERQWWRKRENSDHADGCCRLSGS